MSAPKRRREEDRRRFGGVDRGGEEEGRAAVGRDIRLGNDGEAVGVLMVSAAGA
jgi:hypothetical protein